LDLQIAAASGSIGGPMSAMSRDHGDDGDLF
jgi:hypothetical protein